MDLSGVAASPRTPLLCVGGHGASGALGGEASPQTLALMLWGGMRWLATSQRPLQLQEH